MTKAIKKLKENAKEMQSCPICMVRAVNCKTVQCSHQFCYRCLSKWGRRKGNCPLCRSNIRKIHYKKKIIEPEYLQCFDEQSSILSNQEVQEFLRAPQTRTPELTPSYFAFFLPLITSFQAMNYYSLPHQTFYHSNA